MLNCSLEAINQQINKPITAGADGGFNFSEEQNKDLKSMKSREYLDELQRQVREKQMQKQREKDDADRAEKKMMAEQAYNNPFGRAGGGAPIKDKEGNVMADLKQVRADPNAYSPRSAFAPPPPQNSMGFVPSIYDNQPSFGNNNSRSSDMLAAMMANHPSPFGLESDRNKAAPVLTNGAGEPSYARGGNGIFGDAKVNTLMPHLSFFSRHDI
jgi:hypothetical protein